MSDNPSISAPGSSTYDSSLLHVGDGTWDASRDTFLLPNLQGLPFAAMQYNGMGNRFRDLPEYHRLVRGHAVLAVITFLFVVPTAVFVARFWWRDPRQALRIHIWLQILTVFLSTAVFILGWFAVGPERSLSNPHHGIGVAIYTLVMFQAIFGWLVRKLEKGRVKWKVSVKVMLHQWIGRATALLAVAQVPLGLTLYGSPKIYFILYALWMFVLVCIYFVLSHRYQGGGGDDATSYFSGTRTDFTTSTQDRKHGGHGVLKGVAAGGLAAAALNAIGRRRSSGRTETHTEVTDVRPAHGHHSRHTSHADSSLIEEKHDHHGHKKNHTWRDRLLAGVGVAGAFGLAKHFMGSKKDTHHSEVSGYSSISGGPPYTASRTDISRMEEGRAPNASPGHRIRHSDDLSTIPPAGAAAAAGVMGTPTRQSRNRIRRSGESIISADTSQDFYSPGREKQKSHTVRNTIATMGIAGFLKHKLGQRRDRKDEARIEEMREHERLDEERLHGGPSARPIRDQRRRRNSFTDSEITPLQGSTPGLSRHSLPRPGVVPAASHGDLRASRTTIQQVDSTVDLEPPPPIGGLRHGSSGSSGSGSRNHRRHNSAGGAALAGSSADNRRPSVNSPPLSIKMRMRNDGGRQHVTLRRLSPAEAAAEREAARRRRSRTRTGSISSNGASGDERWRRVEALERAQAAEMAQDPGQSYASLPGPPPGPPPPLHSSSPGGYDEPLPPPPPITGSGAWDTGESAAGSKADSNRRRRRAERAQQAARKAQGNRVEFS